MPTPPASQMPLISRLGAGAAFVFGALMAESGRPARFQSCAPATIDTATTITHAHHVLMARVLTAPALSVVHPLRSMYCRQEGRRCEVGRWVRRFSLAAG